jgi:hypothetical protein
MMVDFRVERGVVRKRVGRVAGRGGYLADGVGQLR